MRMAQGQVWAVLAGRPNGARALPRRSGACQGQPRHAGDDANAKDRDRRSRQGVCRLSYTGEASGVPPGFGWIATISKPRFRASIKLATGAKEIQEPAMTGQ